MSLPDFSNEVFANEKEMLESLFSWSFVSECVTDLLEQTNNAIKKMRDVLEEENYQKLYLIAHELRGSSAQMRLIRFFKITSYLEDICRNIHAFLHQPSDIKLHGNITSNNINNYLKQLPQLIALIEEQEQALVKYLPICMKNSAEEDSENSSDDESSF